jgi:alkylglycerol monooxygenase
MPAFAFDLVRVYRVEIATFVVAYAFAEIVWLRVRRNRSHDPRELFANLFIYVVDTAIRLGTWPVRLALFTLVYSFTPLRMPTTLVSAVVCYLGVDLTLYFWHRVLHETELGWALHSVHHTGREFTLSLGARINWLQRALDDVVYLPLVALGFEPLLVLAMIAFNRLSQYWVHTEMIGKLPPLDAWLNTPSNHRVHHEAISGGRRANYGSNLMLWDRCCGTYRSEQSDLVYGTDAGDLGANPLRIQFAGLTDYVRRRIARVAR